MSISIGDKCLISETPEPITRTDRWLVYKWLYYSQIFMSIEYFSKTFPVCYIEKQKRNEKISWLLSFSVITLHRLYSIILK